MFSCRKIVQLAVITGAVLLCSAVYGQNNLLINGDFERELAGWSTFWSRTPGGRANSDSERTHGGSRSVRVEHTGTEDWSFPQQKRIDVQPGQIYELSGWVWLEGEGSATLSVILYDAQGAAIDWSFGGRSAAATDGWREMHSRFLVPKGVATMTPRLLGNGAATVWLDDARLELADSVQRLRSADLPATLEIANAALRVRLDTEQANFAVTDRRTGHVWDQHASSSLIVINGGSHNNQIQLKLLDPASMLQIAKSKGSGVVFVISSAFSRSTKWTKS